jgi:hypothetical protein
LDMRNSLWVRTGLQNSSIVNRKHSLGVALHI